MSLEDFSLRDLRGMQDEIPSIKGLLGLPLVKTYEDFIDILYNDIDLSISILEEFRQLHKDDSEDRISIQIISNLRMKGYSADHDPQHGGHTDILVRHKSYKWIGEAKIHRDYEYLMEGFNQLTTRYSTGAENESHGSLLIYIFVANVKNVMQTWQKNLENAGIDNLSTAPCNKKQLAFFSTHNHIVSGTQYKVRHIPVMLHFNPMDKSGRASK